MLHLALCLLFDFIRYATTGYYEGETLTTTPEDTDRRRETIVAASERLLHSLVGPGDLLGSGIRSEFAKECYHAFDCPCQHDNTCLRDASFFVTYNKDAIKHKYTTESPFRDIAHAIVNKQDKLNEALFDAVVKRLEEIYPKSQGYDLEEYHAMAVELCLIAASCAGIYDLFFAAGLDKPPLPQAPVPAQPARFEKVSHYLTNPLSYNRDMAWGPFCMADDLRLDVVKKYDADFDVTVWSMIAGTRGKVAPTKGTCVPLTCMETLRFMEATYGLVARVPRVLLALGDNRCLSRSQLEHAATAFSSAKHCALLDELQAFGEAAAGHDKDAMNETRDTLLAARHEHAVLDAAALVGYFSFITKLVDFTGHYSPDEAKQLNQLGDMIIKVRTFRETVLFPFKSILGLLSGSAKTNFKSLGQS